jgi:hypothetical protein
MATATVAPIQLNKSSLNLDEKIADPSSGVALTKADVLALLETNCPDYLEARRKSKIQNVSLPFCFVNICCFQIDISDCGKGNG